MRTVVTLVSSVVLLWTWSLQGSTAEEYDQSDGTSAHGRMYICDLPPRPGPCIAYSTRYYYDRGSGTCQPFIYGGCEGNQNNFPTVSKCIQTCRPEEVCKFVMEPGHCSGHFRRFFFNNTSLRCEPFIYSGCGGNLNNFDKMEECVVTCCMEGTLCPRRTYALTEAEVCHLPPQTGPCQAHVKRFFYNPTSMKCEVFIYGGCDGNQNNFESMAECKRACHKADDGVVSVPAFNEDVPAEACHLPPEPGPCKRFEERYFYDPKTKSCNTFVYGGCEGNQNNFKNKAACMHTCQPIEVCSQPPERGQHTGFHRRLFYNSTSRSCEPFIYSGCGGNMNRFKNTKECMRTCYPVDPDPEFLLQLTEFNPAEICNLPPETGPCEALIERYFYNPASERCEAFNYGGCKGNENNFKTLGQCVRTCHATGPPSEVFDKDVVCNQPPEIGHCKGVFVRHYYDPASVSCKPFMYGGCMGNQNNFKTNAHCMQACLPNEVCDLLPETGPCRGHFQRYYHAPASKKCLPFVYGGCGGNPNNFDTERDCLKFCHS